MSYSILYVYACMLFRLEVRRAALGFCGSACCIMHQSGSLPQEPRGTSPAAELAPRRAPGFTPHEGDMNNRGWRPDCSTTEKGVPSQGPLFMLFCHIESRCINKVSLLGLINVLFYLQGNYRVFSKILYHPNIILLYKFGGT